MINKAVEILTLLEKNLQRLPQQYQIFFYEPLRRNRGFEMLAVLLQSYELQQKAAFLLHSILGGKRKGQFQLT